MLKLDVDVLNKRIVVFAPHPDDETLGCGGTIAKRLAEGYEVFVVAMTDGRNAFSLIFGIKNAPTPQEMKEIRRTEMLKALRILGVPRSNILFFDFEDGKLLYHSKAAASKSLKILNEVRPVEIYFPHERDHNPDHQATNIIMKDCIRNIAFSSHAYSYSLGQRFSRLGMLTSRMFDIIKNNLVYVDVSQFLNQKEAAIKEYKSQITKINGVQNRAVVPNYRRFLTKHEIFHIL
jgi:LmbE family N-acetylglucosaminyl deacetylase